MKPLFCPKLAVPACQSILIQDRSNFRGVGAASGKCTGKTSCKRLWGISRRVEIGSLANGQGCKVALISLPSRRDSIQVGWGFIRGLDLSREQRQRQQCCESRQRALVLFIFHVAIQSSNTIYSLDLSRFTSSASRNPYRTTSALQVKRFRSVLPGLFQLHRYIYGSHHPPSICGPRGANLTSRFRGVKDPATQIQWFHRPTSRGCKFDPA
jgi:hypothetical protein